MQNKWPAKASVGSVIWAGRAAGDVIPLDPVRQPSGKLIHAWAMRRDLDPAAVKSNTFSMEWPPNSGQQRQLPEVNRAAWFSIETARRKLLRGQVPFLDELERKLGSGALSGTRCSRGNLFSRLPRARRGPFPSAPIIFVDSHWHAMGVESAHQ